MNSTTKQIIQHGIDMLDNGYEGIECADLHNELYNVDYYVIGTYEATKQLEVYGTFRAIEEVRKYEIDNFGETYTEVDPEKIINMLAYIVGQEALNDCETYTEKWDEKLSAEDLKAIKQELLDQLI